MKTTDDFEFLKSDLWVLYTQKRYTPLNDIKYRLDQLGLSQKDWPELKIKIQSFRKMGAIPFYLQSLDKNFWYFPSDSIQKKIHQIEFEGNLLFEQIKNHGTFREEFLINAKVEEAITSAIYEGANSTRSKARALTASEKVPKTKDEWMLINNFEALKWIKKNSNHQVDINLILQIHNIVTKNTLEEDDANFYGKFRNDTVHVGNHEGVNFNLIEASLLEAINLTTEHPRFIHALIKGILFHYFIAYIHPFFDGNGRTARSLFYFKAIKNNLAFVELLSVSATLKEYGKKYEKSFDLVFEHDLDMTYFIDVCLDSLLKALINAKRKVEYLFKIVTLKDSYHLNSQQITLLQKMALNKFRPINIEDYAKSIKKSREIARQELKDLSDKKLLIEKKQGKKYVYYIDSKKIKEELN